MGYEGNINYAAVIRRWAEYTPEKEVIVYQDQRMVYREFNERISALAKGLHDLGVRKGDVVSVLLYNCSQFLEIMFAVNRLGAIFLPLNFRLAGEELEYILNDAEASLIFTEDDFHAQINSIKDKIKSLKNIITLSSQAPEGWMTYSQLLDSNLGVDVPDAHVEMDDLQRLMYTSGTTSRPKGVMITYGNVYWKNIAHIMQFNITPDDNTLIVGPLYHVGGLDLPGIGTIYRGGKVTILRKFDPLKVLETIENEKATNVWLAPAMLNMIIQAPKNKQYNLDSIRFIIAGGEKMPESRITQIKSIFRNAWFCDAYGLTETVSGDTFVPEDKTFEKIGSVGKPCIHLDVKIVDDDGNELPPNQIGEIVLRGPKVAKGYWKNPEATQQAFKDGWFHTGDIGKLDEDGFLYIVDRKKDMIISGGENISSLEVERILYEHPKVVEAAVVGKPDEKWGEVPVAFIAIKDGEEATEEEIKKFCENRLARFKIPKKIFFTKSLPRNPSGKVLKRVLRRQVEEELIDGFSHH